MIMKEMLENKLIQDTFEGRVNRMCWWIKKWDAKKKKKKKRRNQGKLQGSWLNNWVYTDDVYRDKED